MDSSELVFDIADTVWGSADGIAPAGSLGNAVGGVLKIPAHVLYFLGDILWDFGS